MTTILSKKTQMSTMNKQLFFFLVALSLYLFSTQSLLGVTLNWTGNTDSNWATASNWDNNSIPTVDDDVVIPNTATSPEIQTGTDAVAKSVLIKTGGGLTIGLGSNLNIDGSAGTAFRNQGEVSNSGSLRIGENANIAGAGIWNEAVFINEAGGEILIDKISTFGIWNFFHINHTATFTNSGKLTMGANETIGNSGIYNGRTSTFTNTVSGEISIDQTGPNGINNYGPFTNLGKITIAANAVTNGNGIQNNDFFTNAISGEIFIEQVKNHAIFNVNGTITNLGKITIDTVNSGTNGIFNIGTFNNKISGEVFIDRISQTGIVNVITFSNSGTIVIGGNAPSGQRGLMNFGNFATFDNETNGEIFIDQTSISGIGNSAPFFNSGKITIAETAAIRVFGIDNNSAFTNETGGEIHIGKLVNVGLRNNSSEPFINKACATIYSGQRILSFGTFQNEGFLLSDDEIGHAISGTFTNTGTIQDLHGAFEGTTFDNQDLLIAPLDNCTGNIFSDALQIGNNNSFTIGSDWYTDETLTTDAGNYDPNTNTFTLDIPTGEHTLYMEVTDSDNACSQIMAIQLTIYTPPTSNIEINDLCPEEDLELQETGDGGIEWAWTGPNGFTSDKQNPVIDAPDTDSSGDYTVIVTSENGCTASQTLNIDIPEIFEFDLSNATQSQTATGMNIYAVELCGGTFPFSINMDATGGFASSNLSPSANTGCQTLQITYTNGVDWTATITDANECSNESSTISSDDLGGTPLLMIDGYTVVQETCPGELNGEITVNVSGGDDSCEDYTYDWSGLNTDLSNTDDATGNTLTGLGAGTYSLTVTDCAGNTALGSINLTRSGSGGRGGRGRGACKMAGDSSMDELLQLFPNPASHFVRIEHAFPQQDSETTIQITDLTGRTLWQQVVSSENRLEVSLEEWTNGLYIVSVKTDSQVRVQKKLLIVK